MRRGHQVEASERKMMGDARRVLEGAQAFHSLNRMRRLNLDRGVRAQAVAESADSACGYYLVSAGSEAGTPLAVPVLVVISTISQKFWPYHFRLFST